MKTKPHHSVGLAALTYALVLLSGDVTGQSGTSTESCIPSRIGNGHCDRSQNTKACGYDGGDCCECTCTSGRKYDCKLGDFVCVDPDASCIGDDDGTLIRISEISMDGTDESDESPCVPDFFADGDCDTFNNVEECGFDGGDCCECTCVSTEAFECGDEDGGGFSCLDPSAPCVDEDDDISTIESSASLCVAPFFGDGDCDLFNNNEVCGYDSGDCCSCTCESTAEFTCGDLAHGGYSCVDPSAQCFADDDVTVNPDSEDTMYYGSVTPNECIPDYLGDGLCDLINNDEICGYDGGDCCQCTCVDTPQFTCGDPAFGGFACLDPAAPCVDDDDVTVFPDDTTTLSEYTETFQCNTGWISDGDCDSSNNNKDCRFDGGDCCECTCVSTMSFTCGDESNGGFDCQDPDAPCVDEDDDIILLPEYDDDSTGRTTSFDCVPGYIADGICDDVNNDAICDFDGGDCCECTCVSTEEFECGDEFFGTFACEDPSAPCFEGVGDDDDEDEDAYDDDEAGDDDADDDEVVDDDDDADDNEVADDDDYDHDDEDGIDDDADDGDEDEVDGPCAPDLSSDGNCDSINNDKRCGFDGGDCCECTCVSTDEYTCGDEAFECVDFTAPCFERDDDSPCVTEYFSDGICDFINNDKRCGFDGGDCCECTCVSTEAFTCGDEAFECVDPTAPCFERDDDGPCVPEYFSDGICDFINNDEVCGFDGGDCCECTCVSTEAFTCGDEAFECVDPDAQCYENANDVLCAPDLVSNGMCDLINNDEVCGYDGGDCCECTCVSTEAFTCGDEAFACVDPSASCVDDEDDATSLESDAEGPTSLCLAGNVSNGVCDPDNNNVECGYDGGDCCECTCVSTPDFTCGDNNGFDCIDPESSCEVVMVEAGTKTTIGVSTNTYDTRAGDAFGSVGCGVDGCGPELTRDGSVGSESRWGCAQKINPAGGLCEIAFVFEDPQDIMEVQVAFYKGDQRSRTLQAMVNGEVVGQFDSNPATPYTSFDIQGTGVENITFTTVGLTSNDWISIFEVRFMVKA